MFYVSVERAHSGMNFPAETLIEALDRAKVYNQAFPNEIIKLEISKKPPLEEEEFDFSE